MHLELCSRLHLKWLPSAARRIELTLVMASGSFLTMHEAAVAEFPFVKALPKREKSRLARLWDHFQEVRAATAEHGVLMPQHYAADLLGVSRQRVHVLVNEGRLVSVDVGGARYVTEASMMAFARSERATGRPLGVPKLRQVFGGARQSVLDIAAQIK